MAARKFRAKVAVRGIRAGGSGFKRPAAPATMGSDMMGAGEGTPAMAAMPAKMGMPRGPAQFTPEMYDAEPAYGCGGRVKKK